MDTEGNTSVLTIEPEGLYSNPRQNDNQRVFNTPVQTKVAPKWSFPKCGARFGFGNKLVKFTANGPVITVHQKGS